MAGTQPAYDLDVLQDGRYLARLVEQAFGRPMSGFAKVGQGFYAAVYRVSMEGAPGKAIVKCHKYPGYSAREGAQLALLARHALLKVPEVYHVHTFAPDLPFEALIMEHIPGVNASRIAFPSPDVMARFADAVVDNLLAWHAVVHPQGFGEIGGPFYPTWLDFFGRRIAAYREQIRAPAHRATVSPYVMSVIERSFDRMPQILSRASGEAVLVHGDYNLWNVMVDPDTYQVTGIIDPIDAGWGDWEIDLFHLPNCRPEVGLLERYLQQVQVDGAFSVRYAFYRFWDDVKHYLRMGWYQEDRFRGYARALEAEMDQL